MATPTAKVPPVLHILHIIVCLCTFGFVFPHALMENEDIKKANLTPITKKIAPGRLVELGLKAK